MDAARPASTEQLIADATEARRGIISALIAVKGHLNQPYPDDDRWTPWTRFVEPAMDKLDESVKALVARVADLEARLRDEEMERGQFQRAYEDEKELREAAEAQVADLEAELTEWRTSIATEALTARAEAAEAQVAALTAEATAAEEARRVSDEAAATWATLLAEEQLKVAALTQERDKWERRFYLERRDDTAERLEAAEAALANTRQALAEIAQDSEHPLTGLGHLGWLARRALAAGDNTTPPTAEAIEAARRVTALVSNDGPPFLLDGQPITATAEVELLSLHDHLNDLRAAGDNTTEPA